MDLDPTNIDAADIDVDSGSTPSNWLPDTVDMDPDPADVRDLNEDADA